MAKDTEKNTVISAMCTAINLSEINKRCCTSSFEKRCTATNPDGLILIEINVYHG